MSNSIESPKQQSSFGSFFASLVAREMSLRERALSFVRQVIAASFWLYVICKLFIFDIDLYLIQKINPSLMWLPKYKFFILIGTLSVLLLITRSGRLLRWLLYIVFYPLILIFWQFPLLVLRQKSWTLAFALINAVLSLSKSIKYKFILAAALILAAFAVFTFDVSPIMVVAIVTILLVLLISYIRMAVYVFRPSTVFQVYSRVISSSPSTILLNTPDKEIRGLPVSTLSAAQIELRRNSIQTLVLWNRVVLFLGHKLRQYQESKLNAVAYSFNLLLLMVVTIFSFAAVNYFALLAGHDPPGRAKS
jgi:hypothetical protein